MIAFAEIRLLLWVQFRALINGLLRGEPSSRLKNWAGSLIRLIAFGAIYVVMRYGFFELAAMPEAPKGMADLFIIFLLHMLGAILLLGAIRYAYQVFYLSDDLEWLLSSPVSSSRIFTAKFIENWMYGGQIVFTLGWPICIAYGVSVRAPFGYYPLTLAATALLAVYTGAVGVLVCLPLMRYVAAKRLRELLLTLSMGLSIGLYIILRQLGYAFGGNVLNKGPEWLPTTQLVEVVRASAMGKWDSVVLPAVIFTIPAIVLSIVAHFLSLRLYMYGLQKKGEEEERIHTARGEGWLYRASLLLPADVRAMALKDTLETIRNPRQWFYLLFAIIFLGFQVLDPIGHETGAVHIFFLVFIASIFSQELTVLGVAREAEMLSLVAASGISSWRLYLAKWMTGFVPTAIFGLIAATAMGIAKGEEMMEIAADAGMVLVGITPLVSYSLMIGSLFPNFKAYRTRQRLSPWVLLLNMFFTFILMALVLFPLTLLRQPSARAYSVWLVGFLIVFPLGAGAMMFALSFVVGSTRLRKFLADVPEGVS